jgi:chromosome segregation ATPase
MDEDAEAGAARPADDGEARKLREDLARLQKRADGAELAAESLRVELRQAAVLRKDAAEQLTEAQNELVRVREQVAQLGTELEAARQQAAEEREQNRRHTDAERQEAERSFAQRLGEALRHDVLNLKETEQRPPSEDQAKFLRSVVNGMIRRLRTAGVPLDGVDVRATEGSPSAGQS